MPLARCLIEYWESHARHLSRSEAERNNLAIWNSYFEGYEVKDIKAKQQREFLAYLINAVTEPTDGSLPKHRYAKSTISGIFKTGVAAITFAWRENMLNTAIPFITPAKEFKKHVVKPKLETKPLDFDEIVALFEAASTTRLFRLMLIMLGTSCRPAAAIELEGIQINKKEKTINLLRPGVEQNNKYRPTVRLPSFIEAIYHKANLVHQGPYTFANPKRPVDTVRKSWETTLGQAKVPEVVLTPNKNIDGEVVYKPLTGNIVLYSFRHTLAKWFRTCSVDAWHVSAQLGHIKEGSQVTEIYASSDPDYLHDVLEATEVLFAIVYQRSQRLQTCEELKKYAPDQNLLNKYRKILEKIGVTDFWQENEIK